MIELNLTKKLGTKEHAFSITLDTTIQKGEFVVLYGKSGAGKTSILRLISGLLKPDDGYISYEGIPWYSSEGKVNLPPKKRDVGLVFQDYALFQNMTVKENLQFAARTAGEKSQIENLIALVELTDLKDRLPSSLSGGQQQRVALARALVQQPQILLLDEPLSALDTNIRSKLQDYILKTHRQLGLTTILVTHEWGEIHKLADRVLVIDQGRISREGKPEEIFAGHQISGKFSFPGIITAIENQDVVSVVSVKVGNQIVKVISDIDQSDDLKPGDHVMVAAKAFSPVIYKLE
ncbi:ABC transporter ATP-binding protein [Robertkochia aurantiaca]|uniref:ABC transporter ATP-binding protein n=1 Tax=Robertkochia aurantiaca TaxID=2873700 RepID=UPI001CCA8BD2|nr:ABC transporter ATP-binding protein [Robertkochia sp. 3YJGBD-33]